MEKQEACPRCGEFGSHWHYDSQTCGRCPPRIVLSDDDMCRLSIIFNRHGNIGREQDRRINEWLKQQIACRARKPSKEAERGA